MFFYVLIYLLIKLLEFCNGSNETSPFDGNMTSLPKELLDFLGKTRRILNGHAIGETRPYMVYLRKAGELTPEDLNWVCGGVIIHEQYILTSAACVEDAKQFFVISGTSKWQSKEDDMDDNECIRYGAKRAIWKCVPKNYVYDGDQMNNFRWVISDIAVVKVHEKFNFNRRIRGCDYRPAMIAYNNRSADFERPGTSGSICGWGSTNTFSTLVRRSGGPQNSPVLMEAEIEITTLEVCKRVWDNQYLTLREGTICGRENLDMSAMSAICIEHHVNCEQIFEPAEIEKRRQAGVTLNPIFRSMRPSGGFCENDHGGPLIGGRGVKSMVIGVITASRVRDVNRRCHGPYLFTSVYYHKELISCAINKDVGPTCRRSLREKGIKMEETFIKWPNKPIGRMGKTGMGNNNTQNSSDHQAGKRVTAILKMEVTTKKRSRKHSKSAAKHSNHTTDKT